jgi:prepilin-type N-terminal cleavage/methylation domain-containing protein
MIVPRKECHMKLQIKKGLRFIKAGIQPDHEEGFSLTEVLIAVLILLVLVATTLPMINSAMKNFKITQAAQIVMMQMRYARQMAIDQRRNMRVSFTDAVGSNPAAISILQLDTAYSVVKTVLQLNLPTPMKFGSVAGVTPVTPESGITVFGSSDTVDFCPNGSAADSTGAYINGYKLVSDGVDAATIRAISIFGTTGRVKSYRYLKGTATWTAE